MKTVLVAAALAVFGFVPAMGSACEYSDDAAASAAPPAQLASTAPLAASKVPARPVAQVLGSKAAKSTAGKSKPAAADRKLAAVTDN